MNAATRAWRGVGRRATRTVDFGGVPDDALVNMNAGSSTGRPLGRATVVRGVVAALSHTRSVLLVASLALVGLMLALDRSSAAALLASVHGGGAAMGGDGAPRSTEGQQAACVLADALSRALPPGAAAQQPVDLTVGVGFYKAGTTELDHVMRQMVPRRCHPLVKEVNWDWEATALSHALEYAGYDEFQEALDLNYTTAQAVWGQAAAISLRDDLRRSYLTGVRGASGADEALRGTGDCGRRVFEFSPLYGSGRKAPCTAKLMRVLFPSAKVLMSVRDPVARAHSHHAMWYSHRCFDVLCPALDKQALRDKPETVAIPLLSHADRRCARLTSEVVLRRLLHVARDECRLTPQSSWFDLSRCANASEIAMDAMLEGASVKERVMRDHIERVSSPTMDGATTALDAGKVATSDGPGAELDAKMAQLPVCANSRKVPIAPYYSPVLHSLYVLYAREWTSRFPCSSVSLYSLESTRSLFNRTVSTLARNVGIEDPARIQHAAEQGLGPPVNGGVYRTATYDDSALSPQLRAELEAFFRPFQAEMAREVRRHGKCARGFEGSEPIGE